MNVRARLDAEMVRRGLVSSRREAAELIEIGQVLVRGSIADKSSRLVAPGDPIELQGPPRKFVGRGAEKLEHALAHFGVSVSNRSVLDAGSSTGGFTDCVLQNGARRVAGYDVGRNQMHERLLADPRVQQHDKVNVRHLKKIDIPFDCSLIVADLSFISLTKVFVALASVGSAEPGYDDVELLVLVKPQFEVGRQDVARGKGVITDPGLHEQAIRDVAKASQDAGCKVLGTVMSPIKGADGNTEFVMHAIKISDAGAQQ